MPGIGSATVGQVEGEPFWVESLGRGRAGEPSCVHWRGRVPLWSPDSVRDLAGLPAVLCCFTSLTLLPSGFRDVQFGLGRLIVHCGD